MEYNRKVQEIVEYLEERMERLEGQKSYDDCSHFRLEGRLSELEETLQEVKRIIEEEN